MNGVKDYVLKKMGVTLLASAILLTAAACGNAGTGGAKKIYSIAISQYVEHPSLDATRQGFLAALKDAGITEGDNLKVDYNNAQADSPNNLSIAQKIAAKKNDLVLAIATPSAIAVAQQVKNSPILFSAVTDPLDAKLITNMDKPGGNITGASDTNPAAITQLMDFIHANFPKVKNLGLIINTGEPNAIVMANTAEKALEKHGMKLVKAPVTNTSEVKQAAQSLVGRADALYITLDNNVVSGVDSIIQIAKENKLPFFSSDRDTVEKGAFATVGFKYYDHGYQVGQMAVDILKNGKKPGDLKVTIPDKLDLILNLKAAASQGIMVTDAMKNQVKDKQNNIIQ